MTKLIMLFMGLTLCLSAQSITIKNVSFDDKIKIGDKELVANGVGMRKATFFKVKVYVSALYLEKKSSDAKKISESPGVKRVVLEFLMSLERSKLTEAWQTALSQHCPKDCSELKNGIAKMNSYMRNVRKKDRFIFTMFPDRVSISVKGKKKEDIWGASFSKALIKVFVGPKEIDEGMAKGLLGKPE